MSSLRERIAAARPDPGAAVEGWADRLPLAALAAHTGLGAARGALAGRSVLLRTQGQTGAAQGVVELDGLARRLVLCPPDLAAEHLPTVKELAGIEAIVTDGPPDPALAGLGVPMFSLGPIVEPLGPAATPAAATEWLLFTSGTSGAPKLVIHSLAGLTGAIAAPEPADAPSAAASSGEAKPVWGTFYDIRRYGGLQVLLRALTGGCALALSDAPQPLAQQLAHLARLGVTHLTGTPSHWRGVLMCSQPQPVAPAYVRLSGEIADQAVLDGLRAAFPQAAIVHAYASTEAGVAFEVTDGREGFPESFLARPGPVRMKVEDGSLRIASPRMASGYAGADPAPLADADGFVDTGDMLALRDGRFRFVGRRSGIINVGGLKVHPEEVEAVINRHPAVRVSRVLARRSPILGAVVSAEVALADPQAAASAEAQGALRAAILDLCRGALPPHKAPASIRFVADLAMTAGGKLERPHG
jgi:acyl-coenzyme A synthetase/AMP-(fatty) acid ligase